MTPAVDELIGTSEALIAALDAHDVDAIEAALPAFGRSVNALKNSGGDRSAWLRSPALRGKVEEAMRLADAARARILYLSDRTQQRLDIFAVAAGRFDATPATYGRPGR